MYHNTALSKSNCYYDYYNYLPFSSTSLSNTATDTGNELELQQSHSTCSYEGDFLSLEEDSLNKVGSQPLSEPVTRNADNNMLLAAVQSTELHAPSSPGIVEQIKIEHQPDVLTMKLPQNVCYSVSNNLQDPFNRTLLKLQMYVLVIDHLYMLLDFSLFLLSIMN